MKILLLVGAFLFLRTSLAADLNDNFFPSNFVFGVSTSAYQIEGAWNESGKGESVLDFTTHTQSVASDGSNGDVACDSYHKLDEDIAMLKQLGVKTYRFSLSWTRILPTGNISDGINQDGVDYYMFLLDKLKSAGIDAMVTLLHFDPPLGLIQDKLFIDEGLNHFFTEYARLAFELYGSKVKYWITINEPQVFSVYGLTTFYSDLGKDSYSTIHNLIKCHASAYHLYNDEFKSQYGGQVSLALNTDWFEPLTKNKTDIDAAERALMFMFGWIAHPLIYGDYPEVMKERVSEYSSSSLSSRLPEFTDEEKEYIKGTVDFIGLNHYVSHIVIDYPNDDTVRTYEKDMGIMNIPDFIMTAPVGMRNVLNWISKTYKNPTIFITENGYADDGILDDDNRINYLQTYLSEVLNAVHYDKINVFGYSVWSLMDNWELSSGYTSKLGLYYVNFTSPGRERTAKKSVSFYKTLLQTRCLVDKCS